MLKKRKTKNMKKMTVITNGYEIVPRQITLEDALKKLGVIRVGGAA